MSLRVFHNALGFDLFLVMMSGIVFRFTPLYLPVYIIPQFFIARPVLGSF